MLISMTEDMLPQSALRIDKPIGCQEDDLYDRAAYVQDLAKALRGFNSQEGLIIGIHGPWGSGKTSLKNMLIEQLNNSSDSTKPIPVVEFNPWMYSGSGRLISLMFKTISSSISDWHEKTRHKLAKAAGKADAVRPIIEAIGMLIPGASASVGEVITAFKNLGETLEPDGRDIEKLSERLKTLKGKLRENKTRIIVFIDDLDRLMDDEVVDMLRAVKAVGDLPYVTYVLLYDRDNITKALNNSCHNKGDEYLEKIIQVPIGVPKPPEVAVWNSLEKELNKITGESTDITHAEDYIAFLDPTRSVYRRCVIPFIHNIRDVIRLSNEFGFRYRALQDDVEAIDLLGITTLEVFRPDLHRWIMGNKYLLCSPRNRTNQEMEYVEARAEGLRHQLDSMLAEREETTELKVKDLAAIKSMFPFVRESMAEQEQTIYSCPQKAERHIYQTEHFDAYFRLTIDQGLLHESDFKEFLLNDQLDGKDLDKKHWEIFTDSYFASKAARYLNAMDASRAAKVVGFCLDLESEFSSGMLLCQSLDVAVHIMNDSEASPKRSDLIEAILQAITKSETVISLAIAASLAVNIKNAILATDSFSAPQRLVQLIAANNIPCLQLYNIENEQMEGWLRLLLDHLKSSTIHKKGKPPRLELMRTYANAIPYLYDTDNNESNNDEYAAFKTFLQVMPDDELVLYVAEALTEHEKKTYSMKLPLLQRLGVTESYKSAVKRWNTDATFKNSIGLNDKCFAAFYAAISKENPTSSVSDEEVNDIIK